MAAAEERIEGIARRAVSGDRHAARELLAAVGADHAAQRDDSLREIARLDDPELWKLLLWYLAGEGWHGQHMPLPQFGVVHDLHHGFIRPYDQPFTHRLAVLRATLHERSARLRSLAAATLGRLHDRASILALVDLLRDPYPEVRIAAAHALQSMPDASGIEDLLNNMAERDFGVRWAAADALRAIGQPALEPLLHELVAHRVTPAFRETAAHVIPPLALTADPVYVNALVDALQRPAAGATVPVAADRLLQWYRRQAAAAD